MKEGRGVGLEIAFTEGEQNSPILRSAACNARVCFYRRELEANPLVIAKP